jgi:hypothetical protein
MKAKPTQVVSQSTSEEADVTAKSSSQPIKLAQN